MIVLPVIERELRACARQPFTYYLRALGVVALMVACFLFGMQHGFGPALGSRLFSSLHFTLFCAIWLLVPLLTSDCLSRERREGTPLDADLSPSREAEPDKPMIRDPALARALDLLKGLAVVRQTRS